MSASIIGKRIGILGGGQLGWMLTFAAHQMGLQVVILDPDPDAPAGQIADQHIIGDFRDEQFIMELSESCDIITTEIEHVNVEALKKLEMRGFTVQPSADTLGLIQDKYDQKRHLRSLNLPVAPFREVATLEAVYAAADELGLPLMLKTRRLAYDGRGNAIIRHREEIPDAFTRLGGKALYAEGWVTFDKELAIMIARSTDGSMAVYPVVETIQHDNICALVIAPAPISELIRQRAQTVAKQAVNSFDGAGVFGVEMFLLPGGEILINEIAPRPHNSGHYTIDACVTSQFEAHLRVILDVPPGDPSLKVGAAVMINVLGVGHDKLTETQQLMDAALNVPGANFYWYGKRSVRAQRKMGHITVVAPSLGELAARVRPLTAIALNLSDTHNVPQVGIIMGSDSDLPTMKQAAAVLRDFGIPFELTIVSAHRTPLRMVEYAQSAHERGLQVIIAGAGGAAHLPGMVAALTPLPVIGVPIRTDPLNGQDALLSIVQMPRGVPVATVAIGNATNAALLAIRILGSRDSALQRQMIDYQKTLETSVLAKASALDQQGWETYTG